MSRIHDLKFLIGICETSIKTNDDFVVPYYISHIALQALKEKVERDNPKPLTVNEITHIIENTEDNICIYVRCLETGFVAPAILDTYKNQYVAIWCSDKEDWYYLKDYGTKWVAYDYPPKEEI